MSQNNVANCPVCDEIVTVNNKSVYCSMCKGRFHGPCVGLKDAFCKAVQEVRNLNFFCETCLGQFDDEDQIGDRLAAVNNASMDVNLDKMTTVLKNTIVGELESHMNILRKDVEVLRESNVDLVRLFTSINPPVGTTAAVVSLESTATTQKAMGVSTKDRTKTADPTEGATSSAWNNKRTEQANKSKFRKVRQGIAEKSVDTQNFPTPINAFVNSKNELIKGKGTTNPLLQAAPEGRNWIWIGGLSDATTESSVLSYGKEKWPDKEFLCFDLKSKSRRKTFKFGSKMVSLEELLDAKMWPEGITVRPFRSFQS